MAYKWSIYVNRILYTKRMSVQSIKRHPHGCLGSDERQPCTHYERVLAVSMQPTLSEVCADINGISGIYTAEVVCTWRIYTLPSSGKSAMLAVCSTYSYQEDLTRTFGEIGML